MLPSKGLEEFVRTGADALGIPVKSAWVSSVSVHLRRLQEAARLVEESELASQEPAPRFHP